MSRDSHTLPPSTWLLVLALSLGWGVNWPLMKIALAEMPVWTFRSVCVWAAAIGLFAIARADGQPLLPPSREWGRLTANALANVTFWNILVAYGLMLLPAGRAVILAYTMPLWAVLLSAVVLNEPLTRRRLAGVALGMGGMGLLIGDELALLRSAPMGALLVIGAAIAWAIGTVLVKRYPVNLPIASFTAWQLLIGGAPMVLGALAFETGALRPLSWPGSLAVAYNVIVAFVICYWIWYKIVSLVPAGVSALGTLLIPVVGVFSGMLVLGERPGWHEYAALALVLASIATVLIPRVPSFATGK
jgi:drug/metabolite transporter (DMT)-like permease